MHACVFERVHARAHWSVPDGSAMSGAAVGALVPPTAVGTAVKPGTAHTGCADEEDEAPVACAFKETAKPPIHGPLAAFRKAA
jgi:hypothetical protein